MTTPTPIYRYPLDGTGLSPDNLVVGEEHQLSTRPVRCVAPTYGGFFAESMIVKDLATDLPLIYNTDYIFGELFEFPTGRYGKEIFGLVVITKPNVTGVKLTYQALGGDYAYSMDSVIAMIDSLNLGDRPVAWGEIIGHPIMFNPASHLHDLGDVYGFEYVVHSIERLRAAILLGDVASHDEIYRYIDSTAAEQANAVADVLAALNAHIADKNNPHAVTKTQIGLSLVQNYATANQAQMDAGVANNLYATPDIIAKYVTDKVGTVLNTHISDKNNPHATTKAHVGLGNVDNFATSDLSTANAGTANDKFMTPYLVEQRIKPVRDSHNNHIDNMNNPHAVTKSQVGLGNVSNYSVASTTDAQAGTSNGYYMTPLRTKEAINSLGGSLVNAHANRVDNPHATTAAQVGSYTKAEVNSLLSGKLSTTGTAYDSSRLEGKTKAEVKQEVFNSLGSFAFNNHFISSSDPDNGVGDANDVWFKF